jgi:hypothetical protein
MPITRLTITVLLILLAVFAAGPASALARGGGGGGRREVRAGGSCGRGASASIRVKERDGGLEAELEVHHGRNERWRVILVHERRVIARGRARTGGRSGSFSFERRIQNFAGPDFVLGRAYGPRGLTCVASAVLPG